jgi:LuxR family maltose regulon positive regulatory protein
MDALPAGQMCLFNTIASLKPIIQFDLGLDAEQSGNTDLAARYFTETVNLASQDHNYHLHFLSLGHLANTQASQSHLHLARQTHEHALSLYTTGSASPYASLAHAGLSALHYEWGDLAAVEQHLNKGLPLARSWNHWESLVPLTLTSARLEYRRGNVDRAISILDELKAPPLEVMHLTLEAYTALLRSYNSDQASASSWLTAKVTPSTLEPSPANETALLDVARLMASLQRLDDAIVLIQKIIRAAESGGRIHTLIQAKTVLARIMALKGNTSDAVACLMEVLQLAAPEGYISTFVGEGETMRQLLNDSKRKVPAGLRNYVERVLMGFGVSENQAIKREAGNSSDLSEREKEILTLIAEGLSNQQIAARLVISITTVKTHVGNIFNKLGVTSRTQALARADGLGLLPRR